MNTASRFISQACATFCIRAKFGLAHRHKAKFKQIFAIIMDKNSKGKQVQTYDKTALLGFVFTQNALKNLFATLAYKAITRTSLSLSLSLSRCSHLWHAFAFNLKGFLLILSRFYLVFLLAKGIF